MTAYRFSAEGTVYPDRDGRPPLCANGNCTRVATIPVHVAYVGDRRFCETCLQACETIGLDVKRLDGIVSLPAWRRRLRAKDLTFGGAA